MITFDENTKRQLIELKEQRDITIEGGILKLINSSNDEKFAAYISDSLEKDMEIRKKRLGVNKKIEDQNKKLTASEKENEKINKQLKEALEKAEKAKELALVDLEVLQKKTQNELVGSIVKVSLWIICGVGAITSLLFAFCTFLGVENQVIQQAWSNMFSILLTNSFSIIGTIMGVKYASEKKSKCRCKDD